MRTRPILFVLLVVVAAAILWGRRDREPDVAPAGDLQRAYGLECENRPTLRLDPQNVPAHLRHLTPLAEKWGIGDDVIRGDCVDAATEAEKQELHDALYEPYEEITAWLDSFGDELMTDETAAFMYMQLALDEMGIYILEEKQGARDGPRP
jgi:hypothetical protein